MLGFVPQPNLHGLRFLGLTEHYWVKIAFTVNGEAIGTKPDESRLCLCSHRLKPVGLTEPYWLLSYQEMGRTI
jgi:hypothetical protein